MKPKLLVVEDEEGLAILLRNNFEIEGYDVEVVEDGVSALERVVAWEPDGIILDIGIPKKDGFFVLAELQAKGIKIPVIVLTARTEEEAVCQGFALGAVDYVKKPCGVRELIARVNAHVGDPVRLNGASPAQRRAAARLLRDARTGAVSFSDYLVDPNVRLVWHGGRRVMLSETEFKLLWALLEHPCETLWPDDLHVKVWGFAVKNPNKRIQVLICRLRKKLGDNEHRLIVSDGAGYRLEP